MEQPRRRRAPPRYVFGDVIERVVNDDGLRKDECFDFDTGKLHTGPARSFASREEGRKWFRSTGADVHGETEEGETGLFGVELAILPVDNQSWDAGDAEELREMIADGPGATPLMSGDGDLPLTYLFRTREGGVGLCQILEVKRTSNARDIRIRTSDQVKLNDVNPKTRRTRRISLRGERLSAEIAEMREKTLRDLHSLRSAAQQSGVMAFPFVFCCFGLIG